MSHTRTLAHSMARWCVHIKTTFKNNIVHIIHSRGIQRVNRNAARCVIILNWWDVAIVFMLSFDIFTSQLTESGDAICLVRIVPGHTLLTSICHCIFSLMIKNDRSRTKHKPISPMSWCGGCWLHFSPHMPAHGKHPDGMRRIIINNNYISFVKHKLSPNWHFACARCLRVPNQMYTTIGIGWLVYSFASAVHMHGTSSYLWCVSDCGKFAHKK